jgi:predicted Zn-dependent peptidase
MRFILPLLLFIFLYCFTGWSAEDSFQYNLPNYFNYQLANGFELILVENHTNPIIATIVVTKTGSRNETPENSGVSHMLEHLTFNGTGKRTQKQLYDELDYYGIYLNAQTSEDYTTTMALNHKDHADKALDIISDMLFNSTFPQEKFEKEKGIVIEEIRKDHENPDYQKELALRKAFFQNPPYSLPVIGNIESIENMTREQVLEYYQTFYSPNNMIALIIGDFKQAEMYRKISRYFGKAPSKTIQSEEIKLNQNFPFYYSEQGDQERILYVKIPAPSFYSKKYIPFQFYHSIAFDANTGNITQALKNDSKLKISKIQPSYEFHPEFGIFTLKITFSNEVDEELIQGAVLREFKNMETYKISDEEILTLKRSEAIAEILKTDKILYYGFLKAQDLAIGGKDAFEKSIPGMINEKKKNIEQFMQNYVNYWSEPEQLFDYSNWPSKVKLSKYKKKSFNSTKERSRIYRHTFPNGLKAILLQNADNAVLAMHFLFKNRAAWEPNGKSGITDFLHHSLFKSSRNFGQQDLQKELKNIGAEVKAYDWDFIPYDNYYNVPEYSYLRILTLDQFFERALEICTDNILHPNLVARFDEIKTQMTALSKRNQMSARETARLKFLRLLMGHDHPLSQPVSGSSETIQSIQIEDLRQYHREYFSAGNTILSIVSSLDSSKVFSAIEKQFATMPLTTKEVEIADIPIIQKSSIDSTKIGSQQAYIYLGYSFISDSNQTIPLRVMNDMLSNQIAFSLREQKGWAYRLGSTIKRWKNHSFFYVSMGTGRETTQPAIQGIISEIDTFKQNSIEAETLERTKNSILGSLVRRRASRESQAYTLGMNAFNKLPDSHYFDIYDLIKGVSVDQVTGLKTEYLQTESYSLFYTIPEKSKKADQMPGMPSMMRR